MSATTVQGNVEVALTAHDRCDGCGAQAYVRATMPFGELLFCAHHWHASEEHLVLAGAHVYDETHKLEPTIPEPVFDLE